MLDGGHVQVMTRGRIGPLSPTPEGSFGSQYPVTFTIVQCGGSTPTTGPKTPSFPPTMAAFLSLTGLRKIKQLLLKNKQKP